MDAWGYFWGVFALACLVTIYVLAGIVTGAVLFRGEFGYGQIHTSKTLHWLLQTLAILLWPLWWVIVVVAAVVGAAVLFVLWFVGSCAAIAKEMFTDIWASLKPTG